MLQRTSRDHEDGRSPAARGVAAARSIARRARALLAPLQRAPGRLRRRAEWAAAAVFALLAAAAAGALSPAAALVLALLAVVPIALVPFVDEIGNRARPEATQSGAALPGTVTAAALPAAADAIDAIDAIVADDGAPGWRLVVDALPEPALVLDRIGIILHHNALLNDLFPRARDGMALSHMSRNPALIEAVDGAKTVGQPVTAEIVERIPVDRRIAVTVSRLADRRIGGGRPAILVILRDLSEQDRLDQMRADFVANASHELRTPLASLLGFVETLQGPARNDAAARDRFLGLMAVQATRMTRLVDDLLSLSRLEMRAHLPPRNVVDLAEVVSFVQQTLEPLAASASITVTVTAPDGPLRIRGDRDEIVQVVQNLMQNALKYGRVGGKVTVALERETEAGVPRLSLAVIDDGPGIAPEHLPRLTERFYRVNVASSREKGGTGLGLAIVKHVLLRHGGELRISSEPGVGSRFVVLLDELVPSARPTSEQKQSKSTS